MSQKREIRIRPADLPGSPHKPSQLERLVQERLTEALGARLIDSYHVAQDHRTGDLVITVTGGAPCGGKQPLLPDLVRSLSAGVKLL